MLPGTATAVAAFDQQGPETQRSYLVVALEEAAIHENNPSIAIVDVTEPASWRPPDVVENCECAVM